jgi:hypothetical protein
MINPENKIPIICVLFLIISSAGSDIFSQQFDIRKHSFFLPGEVTPGKITHLVGLAAIKMPEEIIEDETFLRMPLAFYKVKIGMPGNFSLKAAVESNIITYHFEGGVGWNLLLDNFSFYPELRSSFWTGRLEQYGFDSGMRGFDLTPALSTGYSFRKFSVTLTTELLYQISNTIRSGDIVVSREPRRFNGYSAGIFVEQPLWKNNIVVIGFKSQLIELYYPVWVAFSTFKRRFHVTEASVGLVL